MISRSPGTVIAAPGTDPNVSIALARIARCPLSASDECLNPIMLPSASGRVLSESLAVGLGKLIKPGGHHRQGERPAVGLAGRKKGHVDLCPQRLPRGPVRGSPSGRPQAAGSA